MLSTYSKSPAKAPKRKRRFRSNDLQRRALSAAVEAPYIWTTKAALDRLKDTICDSATLAVYIALVWLQNNSRRDVFYASFAQIAAHAGCGARTAQKKIALLNRAGLIGVKSGIRSKSFHEANQYFIASTRSAIAANRDTQKLPIAVWQSNPDSNANSKEPKQGSLTTSAPIGTSGDIAPAMPGAQGKETNPNAW